jgi:hypothetical protein
LSLGLAVPGYHAWPWLPSFTFNNAGGEFHVGDSSKLFDGKLKETQLLPRGLIRYHGAARDERR